MTRDALLPIVKILPTARVFSAARVVGLLLPFILIKRRAPFSLSLQRKSCR